MSSSAGYIEMQHLLYQQHVLKAGIRRYSASEMKGISLRHRSPALPNPYIFRKSANRDELRLTPSASSSDSNETRPTDCARCCQPSIRIQEYLFRKTIIQDSHVNLSENVYSRLEIVAQSTLDVTAKSSNFAEAFIKLSPTIDLRSRNCYLLLKYPWTEN